MKTKFVLFLLITSGIFSSQSNLLAQGKMCLLFEGSYSVIKGGFDGETIYGGGGEGFLVPKLKSTYGYGVSFGGVIGNNFYIGVKYARFKYDAAFHEVDIGKARNNLFGIEFKLFFPGEGKDSHSGRPKIQFFPLLGVDFGTLKVENAYVKSSATSLLSASFYWVGVPLGAGISINPIKALSISFDVAYRFATVTTVGETGSDADPWKLADKLGMGGTNCNLGLTLHF